MNRRAKVASFAVLLVSLAPMGYAQTYGRVQETDPSIVYEGNWQTVLEPTVSGGSMRVSNEAGASATLTFNGSGAGWIGYKCPCAGIARIFLDGVEQDPKDMYDVNHDAQVIGVYPYTLDSSVPHVLKIVVSGERNSSSTDTYVAIDAFDIGPPAWGSDPLVDIISPRYAEVVSGMVTISAEAFDVRGVVGVVFTADDSILLGYDRAPPYSVTVDTSGVPHGSKHLIKAVAYSPYAGSRPALVEVTVDSGGAADVYPPTAQITAPAPNSFVTGVVTISANASDNVGVTKVQFIANGSIIIGEDSSPPYSITRDTSNLPSGSQYTLTARAYDAAGLISNPSGVNVTVQH